MMNINPWNMRSNSTTSQPSNVQNNSTTTIPSNVTAAFTTEQMVSLVQLIQSIQQPPPIVPQPVQGHFEKYSAYYAALLVVLLGGIGTWFSLKDAEQKKLTEKVQEMDKDIYAMKVRLDSYLPSSNGNKK